MGDFGGLAPIREIRRCSVLVDLPVLALATDTTV